MKQNFTRITILLDRSQSMDRIRESTITGYNELITEQKNSIGECKISLKTFNSRQEYVYNNLDIKETKELSYNEFLPSGTTALYDAIGVTIDELGLELSNMSEDQRPDKVLFFIITDGEENSSKQFNHQQVKSMIEHQSNVYNWTFMFIGGGIDAKKSADDLSITRSVYFQNNPTLTRKMFSKVSSNISNIRSMSNQEYLTYSKQTSNETIQ